MSSSSECSVLMYMSKDTLCDEKGLSRRAEPVRHANDGMRTSSICPLSPLSSICTIIQELTGHDENFRLIS